MTVATDAGMGYLDLLHPDEVGTVKSSGTGLKIASLVMLDYDGKGHPPFMIGPNNKANHDLFVANTKRMIDAAAGSFLLYFLVKGQIILRMASHSSLIAADPPLAGPAAPRRHDVKRKPRILHQLLKLLTYPMSTVTEKDLMQAACHLGHPRHKWNPKMAPYIYGMRNKVHIFDLIQTKKALDEVCDILAKLQAEGKTVLFASTKQQSIIYIEMFAEALGQPIVTKKWMPGLLTNWNTISKRIKHYLDLQTSFKTGEIEKYTKKEQTQLRKELTKLDIALGGVSAMTAMPDALFVIDAVRDRVAVLEANKLRIPVYGICDSNADPDLFTKCIPGNDDAVKSIELIMNTVLEAMGGSAPAKKEKSSDDEE